MGSIMKYSIDVEIQPIYSLQLKSNIIRVYKILWVLDHQDYN